MVEQPHFDDERTLLRARPVVPLEQVDVKIRHRRRWFLGGAFAIAMFLGAASALASAYFKFRSAPDPEIQPEIQTLSVLPVPSVSSVTEQRVESASPAAVVQAPRHRPKVRSRNMDNRDYTRMSEDEALHRIRDSVLVDEWQERRARRVERRERRRAQHHDRDASNINEIFEGTRRPWYSIAASSNSHTQ